MMATLALIVFIFLCSNSRWCVCFTSVYQRPPRAGPLPLDHPLLQATSSSSVEQVHVSLLDAHHVIVNWVTPRFFERHNVTIPLGHVLALEQQGCTSQPIRSLVQYSQDESFAADVLEVEGSFTCYSTGDYDSGLLHRAVVGPLESSTAYYYRCSDATSDWSKIYALKTPPDSATMRVGFVGDLGQTQYTASTLDHLQESAPDMIINVGDLSYADGEQPRWDSYARLMESLVSEVPMMATEGNHEIEDFTLLHAQSNLQTVDPEFVAYETRYTVPSANDTQNPSSSPLFYSIDVASIHIVMLGTYADNDRGSDQYLWLEKDLASINRSVTPWVIVGMHAPWYNSNTAHQHEADDMQDAMEPLLFKYGVDLVFSGHVHAYERTSRVYADKPNECGPYYVVIGDGGNREGLAGDWLDQPDWSLFRESSYGHGLLTVENATHAHWQWYRNDADVKQVSDGFWAVRNPNCAEHHKEPPGHSKPGLILGPWKRVFQAGKPWLDWLWTGAGTRAVPSRKALSA